MEHFPVRPWLNFFMVLVFLWVQFPLSQGTATPNGTSLFTKCRAMLAFRDPILVQKICGTSLEGKSTDASQTTTSHGGTLHNYRTHSLRGITRFYQESLAAPMSARLDFVVHHAWKMGQWGMLLTISFLNSHVIVELTEVTYFLIRMNAVS